MTLRRLLLAALVLGAAVACEYRITGYAEQPPMTHEADRSQAYVVTRWVSGVDELQSLGVCQYLDGRITVACAQDRGSYCVIYTVKPKDFNDVVALADMGHELLHCLGGQHG